LSSAQSWPSSAVCSSASCLSPDNRQASGRELGAASGPHLTGSSRTTTDMSGQPTPQASMPLHSAPQVASTDLDSLIQKRSPAAAPPSRGRLGALRARLRGCPSDSSSEEANGRTEDGTAPREQAMSSLRDRLHWVRCKLRLHRWRFERDYQGKLYRECRDCGAVTSDRPPAIP
jgi:hypothetical protein